MLQERPNLFFQVRSPALRIQPGVLSFSSGVLPQGCDAPRVGGQSAGGRLHPDGRPAVRVRRRTQDAQSNRRRRRWWASERASSLSCPVGNHSSTGCVVRSVARFCHFLSYMFLVHDWAAWTVLPAHQQAVCLSKHSRKPRRPTERRIL